MTPVKILGIVLLVLGVLALVYQGFTYTKDTHEAKLGPLELSVQEKEKVAVPTWVGIAAVVVGAGLLLMPARR